MAAIALPVVGGLGIAARNSAKTFDNLPTALEADGRPPETSVITAANGQTIANLYLQNRAIVELSEIAPVARKALIAIEDSRFYEHNGFDTRGTLRALLSDTSSGEATQGGSTLTQQYVKQVLLYSAKTEAEEQAAIADTLGRKLREARIAVALEDKLSKDEILSRYLNIAYFGSGAYGIETAAQTYFGIPAAELNLPQAALLAGLVQSPTGYDPHEHMDRALERRHTVLFRMAELGYITRTQAAQADRTPIELIAKPEAPQNGCTEVILPDSGFFCDYVRSYLTNVLHLTQQQLYQGGLTIKTTLDPAMQQNVMSSLTSTVPKGNPAAGVMDIVEPGTGRVQAMGVTRDFDVDADDPKDTTINLATKPVALAGSTYKVFTLAAALEQRVPFDYAQDSPAEYDSALFDAVFHNDSESENGAYTLEHATVQSVNTYFIKLLESPYFNGDLTKPVRIAQKLGMGANSVTDSVASEVIDNKRASFTLGAVPTSPLDMANAFATIAAKGKWCPPNPILSITGPDGKQLPIKKPKCKQVMEEKIAVGLSDILKGDVSDDEPYIGYNTAGNAALDDSHPAAGKTGTTNDNSAVWFAGYTPTLSGATAIFDPDAPSRKITTIPDQPTDVYGDFAAEIWQQAVQPIVEKQQPWSWPPAEDSVRYGDSEELPCLYGVTPEDAHAQLLALGFTPIDGDYIWSAAPAGTVADQSPACGGRFGKGTEITLTFSAGPSPTPTTTPPPTKPSDDPPDEGGGNDDQPTDNEQQPPGGDNGDNTDGGNTGGGGGGDDGGNTGGGGNDGDTGGNTGGGGGGGGNSGDGGGGD